MNDLIMSMEAIPFNHWLYDNRWLVQLKGPYRYYYIEAEGKTPDEAVENAVNQYFGENDDE